MGYSPVEKSPTGAALVELDAQLFPEPVDQFWSEQHLPLLPGCLPNCKRVTPRKALLSHGSRRYGPAWGRSRHWWHCS